MAHFMENQKYITYYNKKKILNYPIMETEKSTQYWMTQTSSQYKNLWGLKINYSLKYY